MKTNRQKYNWILDAILFCGFLLALALDLTGLSLHQWVGVLGGALVFFHLILHRDWIVCVARRFFSSTSKQARWYFVLDMSILVGISGIAFTGVLLSTWLDLPLVNYQVFSETHETTSYVTLGLILAKIASHAPWIMRVIKQPLFSFPAPVGRQIPSAAPVAFQGGARLSRGDFLKLMGVVGIASFVAACLPNVGEDGSTGTAINDTSSSVSNQDAEALKTASQNSISASVTSTPMTTSTTDSTTAPVYSSTLCAIQCGKHCSFPGNCRRYQDTNSNNLCDMGECF